VRALYGWIAASGRQNHSPGPANALPRGAGRNQCGAAPHRPVEGELTIEAGRHAGRGGGPAGPATRRARETPWLCSRRTMTSTPSAGEAKPSCCADGAPRRAVRRRTDAVRSRAGEARGPGQSGVRALFGYSEEEMVGASLADLIVPDDELERSVAARAGPDHRRAGRLRGHAPAQGRHPDPGVDQGRADCSPRTADRVLRHVRDITSASARRRRSASRRRAMR